MAITELRCPSCTAPVDLTAGAAHACRYCGAALVVDDTQPKKRRKTLAHVRYVVVLTRCGPSNYERLERLLRARGMEEAAASACVRGAPCELPKWDEIIPPADLARQIEEAGAQAQVEARVTTEVLPPDVRIVLEDGGANKVGVMRALRAFIDLDLAASKALVARAPITVVESIDGKKGRALHDALVAAGARVTLTELDG